MSRFDFPYRSKLMCRVGIVALLSGLAAGCSSGVERFGGPMYTGGTQNQRDILGGAPQQPSYNELFSSDELAENGAANARVSRSTLPPVAGYGVPIVSAQGPKPVPLYTGSVGSQRAVVAQPSMPAKLPSVARSQRGWSGTGGTLVTLGQGESVQSASRRYGVPVNAIQSANNLGGDPSAPRTGQQLLIPTYNYGSPIAAGAMTSGGMSSGALTAGAPSTANYDDVPALPKARRSAVNVLPVRTKTVRVASNDTVIPGAKPSQPRVASIDPRQAPRQPRIVSLSSEPKRKPSVQAIRPRIEQTQSAAIASSVATPVRRPANSTPQISRTEPSTVAIEPKASRVSPVQEASNDAPVAEGSANRFRWPVRGRVISGFGQKPGGTRNDGINLAVPEGTQVRSVESGTVIYAGNELKGYGNLVLIRHEDGWVSAYAHNSELDVRRGDTVRRGDVVAKAGSSGSVSQPQLHFELRRGNKPVDPLQYLTKV